MPLRLPTWPHEGTCPSSTNARTSAKEKMPNLKATLLAQVRRMRVPGWPRLDECEHLYKRENHQLESDLADPSPTNASTSTKENPQLESDLAGPSSTNVSFSMKENPQLESDKRSFGVNPNLNYYSQTKQLLLWKTPTRIAYQRGDCVD